MEKNKKEIITVNTMKNKDYKMRQFSALCKYDLLLTCAQCSKILCSSSLIDKILRLSNGKICLIIEEEDEDNSELIKKFNETLFIQNKKIINQNNEDLKAVGLNEIFCKKCKYSLGIKVMLTDVIQEFMLNKILLKFDSIKFFTFGDFGIKPFNFYFRKETIKSMDNYAMEIDEYIQKSGNYIQTFFDMLSSQNKEIKDMEKTKEEIDKLGNVLKYLIDKNYI